MSELIERFTTFATLFPQGALAFIQQFELQQKTAEWAEANGHVIEMVPAEQLTFGQYEKWAKALRAAKPQGVKDFNELSVAEWHGTLLRTALASGNIIAKITPQGLTAAGVAQLPPLVVRFYGEKLAEFYALVTQPPLVSP